MIHVVCVIICVWAIFGAMKRTAKNAIEEDEENSNYWKTPPPGGWPDDPRNIAEKRAELYHQEQKIRYEKARQAHPDWPKNPPACVCPAVLPRP